MRRASRLIRVLARIIQPDVSKLKLPQAALFKCTLVFHENICRKKLICVFANCRLVGNKHLF